VDRRPWLWDDWAIDAMRKAYHLRSEIFPYIYTSVRQTHESMVPLTRAMYIDYPSLEKAYNSPQQYLLGDNMIVAPVASVGSGPERTAKVKVWIPDGEKWYGYYDGKCYEGGHEYEVEADIDEIPVFVRGGAVLPMQPYTRRMGSAQIETLRCRIYPSYNSEQTVTMLYEDDGVTREYENGAYAKTYMTSQTLDGIMTIKINPTEGTYSGQPQSRSIVVELPGLSENAVIKAPRKAKIERKDGITYISCPGKSIRDEQVIKITNPYCLFTTL
jgi:alpha-glucosidase (family GH31 glycosyl hydrolase)